MNNKKTDALIKAIAFGNVQALETINNEPGFELETWICNNGYYQQNSNGPLLDQSQFEAYVKANEATKLVFLSIEGMTDEQLNKIYSHEQPAE